MAEPQGIYTRHLSAEQCRAALDILDKAVAILEDRATEQQAEGFSIRANSLRRIADDVLNVMDLFANNTGNRDNWLASRNVNES